MDAGIQGTTRLDALTLEDGTVGDMESVEWLDTVYGRTMKPSRP